MGVNGEDTGNMDMKLFDRANFHLADFKQWNVGSILKNKKIILGFRTSPFGVAYRTTGYEMSADDAIKIGEALVSAGVAMKSATLTQKNMDKGGLYLDV